MPSRMDLIASYDSESEDEALSPRPLVELKSDLRLVIIRALSVQEKKTTGCRRLFSCTYHDRCRGRPSRPGCTAIQIGCAVVGGTMEPMGAGEELWAWKTSNGLQPPKGI